VPARLVQVTIINKSDYAIVWQDDGREHGDWQEPWYPSNIKNLQPRENASFRLESDGVMTGVEGWALKVDVPFAPNVGSRTEFFQLHLKRPYIMFDAAKISTEHFLSDPRTDDEPHTPPALTDVKAIGYFDLGRSGSDFLAFLGSSAFGVAELGLGPLGPVIPGLIGMAQEAVGTEIAWVVEVRNLAPIATVPQALSARTKGVIYAVSPHVDARIELVNEDVADRPVSPRQIPGTGGDLIWFEHLGRLDGSFRWEGPSKVGVRWDSFAHLFSPGDGIIYAVTPRADAVFDNSSATLSVDGHHAANAKAASGGELVWYRHVGETDGTFRWLGPKLVGVRWDEFRHLFCGDDGVVYGVDSQGALMWYRHVGQADGSFIWQGPHKVGTGWGSFTRIFSGGDGIIYAVTPRTEAGVHITGGVVPASGGDLIWYRHRGWEDGSFDWEGPKIVGRRWDGFEHLLSNRDGIIYGVMPFVPAKLSLSASATLADGRHAHGFTPASGGELMWYQHLGHSDGRFEWSKSKKVGTGWSGLSKLFAGGTLP
jgi:tachylectin